MARFALFCLFLFLPALAMAEDEVFIVKNISVKAQNEKLVDAKKQATLDGQTQAFTTLLQRILPVSEQSRLPSLLKNPLAPMIKSMDIHDEKSRDGQYSATLDMRFNSLAVKKFLKSRHVNFIDQRSEKYLIIPTYQASADQKALLWDEGNLWLSFLRKSDLSRGLVQLGLIQGSDEEKMLLTPAVFDDLAQNNNATPLMDVAKKYNAEALFLAEVKSDNGQLTLTMRRIDSPNPDPTNRFSLQAQNLETLGDQMIDTLNNMWKEAQGSQPASTQRIGVHLELADLKAWVDLKQKLANLPNIQQIDVVSVAKNDIYVMMTYKGTFDELKTTLEEQGVKFHRE